MMHPWIEGVVTVTSENFLLHFYNILQTQLLLPFAFAVTEFPITTDSDSYTHGQVVKVSGITSEKNIFKAAEKILETGPSKVIIKKQRLETPPNIKWHNTFPLRYKGTINRHNQKSGLNFGFTQNLSEGIFYYNFKDKLEKGNITFTGTNQHGYWFNWNDKYGQGNLQLREYTDGSLKGVIYIDNGTMLGQKLGDFIGYKK